jgi:hypothetical protein
MISEDSNTAALRSALTKVVGGKWTVAVSGAAPAAEQPAEDDPREDADDPSEEAAGSSTPVDPETEALKLLRDKLDARPLDS